MFNNLHRVGLAGGASLFPNPLNWAKNNLVKTGAAATLAAFAPIPLSLAAIGGYGGLQLLKKTSLYKEGDAGSPDDQIGFPGKLGEYLGLYPKDTKNEMEALQEISKRVKREENF